MNEINAAQRMREAAQEKAEARFVFPLLCSLCCVPFVVVPFVPFVPYVPVVVRSRSRSRSCSRSRSS